ncbi:MAG: hypothetical protein ACR2OU_12780 [Thermomicrobiales bacterium]
MKIKQRLKDQHAWEAEHGNDADPDRFAREILPVIQDVSLTELANATGLSVQYCGLIRRGLKVPH